MTIEKMQEFWHLLFPKSVVPGMEQFAIWLLRFSEYAVRQGIARTAIKYQRLNGDMSDEFLEKYASAAMARIMDEQKKEAAI
jgi:hypothetical protein